MKMYIVVNDKLKDKGLISAQVAHAVFDELDRQIKGFARDNILYELSRQLDVFRYNGNGMIVLKAPEDVLKNLCDLGETTVIDRTMNNMITAVNLGIHDDNHKPPITKILKLL